MSARERDRSTGIDTGGSVVASDVCENLAPSSFSDANLDTPQDIHCVIELTGSKN